MVIMVMPPVMAPVPAMVMAMDKDMVKDTAIIITDTGGHRLYRKHHYGTSSNRKMTSGSVTMRNRPILVDWAKLELEAEAKAGMIAIVVVQPLRKTLGRTSGNRKPLRSLRLVSKRIKVKVGGHNLDPWG